MTPKQFVERAIEGGWRVREKHVNVGVSQLDTHYDYHAIIHDPLAWQAVGKVEGWEDEFDEDKGFNYQHQWHMHRMVDSLCEGKSIEQFLETL